MVGNSEFEPTSVVYFQQRSHLTPSARSIATFRASALLVRLTWETIKSAGKSFAYCSSSGYRAPSAERLTRASSGAPINLSWRAVSRLFKTSSLTSMRRSQFCTRFRRSGERRFEEPGDRSEEHTSELQSLRHLVCRLLLEKQNSEDTRV